MFALVASRGTYAQGQDDRGQGLKSWDGKAPKNPPVHLTMDWSHRHLVFFAPHDAGQHIRLLSNPRYVQQLARHNAENKGNGDGGRWRRAPEPDANLLKGDWSLNMGTGATVGEGNYPAKFSFDSASANCAEVGGVAQPNPDFVVYNTSLAGVATDTGTASQTGRFTGLSANSNATSALVSSQIATIGGTLILYSNTGASPTTAAGTVTPQAARPNAGDTVTMGPVGSTTVYRFENALLGANDVLRGANGAESAGNLEAAINDDSTQCVSAVPCFGAGITAPNAAGTATIVGSAVTITAPVTGAANNFWLASSSATRLPVTGAARTGGSGSNTGLNFLAVTNATTTATNFVAAVNRAGNGDSVGVTADNVGGTSATVTITATTPGPAGNSITLTKSLNNFTWAGPSLLGGAAQATIGAWTNLYVGTCSGDQVGVPNTYWAYDTGSTGAIVTSTVLSIDGTQVAFVQNMGITGTLVLLKWVTFDGAFFAPTDITDSPGGIATATTHTVSNANYRTCTAPCMTLLPFPAGGTITDTNSSPFYDYAADKIYVGDDGGHLRAFDNVFKGTPSQETIAGGFHFPVAIPGGGVLTSPVYDSGTGKVLVASSSGFLTGVVWRRHPCLRDCKVYFRRQPETTLRAARSAVTQG
jgi:hypothetical protein